MAIGEPRQVFRTNIEISVSGVAERGGIISYDPVQVGNGIYADAVAVSGLVQPAGLLLDDVEAMNFFRGPDFLNRNVVPQGSVVGLLTGGELYTDFVETTLAGISVGTYAAGDPLYLGDLGKVSRSNGTFGNLGTSKRVRIGTALSTYDAATGFLHVRIEL